MRRALDHFQWDDGLSGAELDGADSADAAPPAVPHTSVHHMSLDQLLQRAADRRTQRGGAPG